MASVKRLGAQLRDHPNSSAREVAATQLGVVGTPAAVGHLLVGLRDSEPSVRRVVLETLVGFLGDPRVTPAIMAMLKKDSEPSVRLVGREGLFR